MFASMHPSKPVILAVVLFALTGRPLSAEFGRATGIPQKLVDRLASRIVENSIQRVGVLPQFRIRDGAEFVLRGPLAPHARLFAEQIEEGLIRTSMDRFRVINGSQLEGILKDMKLDDLKDPEKMRPLAGKLGGMDALILGTLTETGGGPGSAVWLDLSCEIIRLADSTTAGKEKASVAMTVAGLAYTGRSMELRRWEPQGLVNVGLNVDRPQDAFRPGEYTPWSAIDPQSLRPISSSSVWEGSPFLMSIVAQGQPLAPVRVGNDVYVSMDYNVEYVIEIKNTTDKDVYVAVFVDGLNIQDKKREDPCNCKYWHLEKHQTARFSGWYVADEKRTLRGKFVTTGADDSVAGRQGFYDSLGLITAVFYTIGTPSVDRIIQGSKEGPRQAERQQRMAAHGSPKGKFKRPAFPRMGGNIPSGKRPTSVGPGAIGTGEGEVEQVELKWFRGQSPGLILASISVNYRSPSGLEDLIARNGGTAVPVRVSPRYSR